MKRHLKILPLVTWPDHSFLDRRTYLETARVSAMVLACMLAGIAALFAIDRAFAALIK